MIIREIIMNGVQLEFNMCFPPLCLYNIKCVYLSKPEGAGTPNNDSLVFDIRLSQWRKAHVKFHLIFIL
jgi:hypothetical protein